MNGHLTQSVTPSAGKYLLIYGSETGQSEAISERIAADSASCGLEAELLRGDELVGQMERLNNQVVVFVVSSTGEGDPPENFEQFWSALHDKPPDNMTYTLLGLGDSNYTDFGGFPNSLREFLENSGSRSFYDFQLADDQVGLEHVVEPWIEGMWEPLAQVISNQNQSHSPLTLDPAFLQKLANLDIDSSSPKTKKMFHSEFSEKGFDHSFPHGVENFILPFAAGKLEKTSIVSKICLTEKSAKTKETFELELKTDDVYGPGDSFGVLCQNSEAEVWELITRLGLKETAHKQYTLIPDPSVKPRLFPKHVLLECSVYYALKYTLDLRSLPKKSLLLCLAEHCADEKEKRCLRFLSSKEGSKELNDMIYSRSLTLLEILTLFPSCCPPFSSLLQFLPRLTPRYYSVSRISQHGVKFVFNHVTDIRSGSQVNRAGVELCEVAGVCSSWLRELSVGENLFIYRRKNTGFKPAEGGAGMVMVGAGTGVAPFLGFLDHLAKSNVKTNTVLITGNRYRDLDSIYGKEFSEHHSNGTLSTYWTAHSRDDNSTCKYVQDVIKVKMVEVVGKLDEGASVYVCGDAKGLSVGVYEMLCSVLSEVKGISEAEAKETVTGMKKEGRYREDIWS